MPHNETVNELVSQFGISTRTTVALLLIAGGILLAIVGALLGVSKKQSA
jgi:hypothetical protein